MTDMKIRPTASVCIVTFNSSADIAACLNAVLQQTLPFESIVVVDNASSDLTLEALRPFEDSIALLANSVNNGFAGGQNQAIKHTSSDYVLVLNPDVVVSPDYLERIIDFMEQNPTAGSATGQLILADRPELLDSAGLIMGWHRQARDLGAGEPAANWGAQLEVFGVSGAAAVYARRMIDDIEWNGQFFDEEFFAYKEDVDAAWRARRLGWKSYYIPDAKAIHKRGWKEGGRRSIPLFVRKHSYQNRFYTLIKNEPFGLHWLYLMPAIAAVELVKLGYILLREPELLQSWPVIIRTFPGQLTKRRWLKARINEKGVGTR
jgi:GT2 family glycosyltransferase